MVVLTCLKISPLGYTKQFLAHEVDISKEFLILYDIQIGIESEQIFDF